MNRMNQTRTEVYNIKTNGNLEIISNNKSHYHVKNKCYNNYKNMQHQRRRITTRKKPKQNLRTNKTNFG